MPFPPTIQRELQELARACAEAARDANKECASLQYSRHRLTCRGHPGQPTRSRTTSYSRRSNVPSLSLSPLRAPTSPTAEARPPRRPRFRLTRPTSPTAYHLACTLRSRPVSTSSWARNFGTIPRTRRILRVRECLTQLILGSMRRASRRPRSSPSSRIRSDSRPPSALGGFRRPPSTQSDLVKRRARQQASFPSRTKLYVMDAPQSLSHVRSG